MPRQPVVSRTIKMLHVTFYYAIPKDAVMSTRTTDISARYKGRKNIEKIIADTAVKPGEVFVSIKDITESESLYVMSEDDFIKVATSYPSRNTKNN